MKLHRVKALLLKYWYTSLNRYDRIFDLFYWPLIDLLVWGFLTLYLEGLGDQIFLSFLISGAVLWHFFVRANNDIGVYVLEDFWSRNLYNLFSSPMRTSELVVSIVLFALLRGVVSFLFLSFLAILFYSFNIYTLGLALLPFAGILIMFGWAVGLIVSGLIYRYGQHFQVIAWSFGWLIQPFSCVFYPLSALPSWVQKISLLLPTTHVFEGMRAALRGEFVISSLTWALALNVIFFVLSVWFFYRSLDKAKKTGQLAKSE